MPDHDDQWHRDTGVPLRYASMDLFPGPSFQVMDGGGLNMPEPHFRTVDSPLPDWATSELCSRILRAIADGFFDREHADHVVELHNEWLANREEDENE